MSDLSKKREDDNGSSGKLLEPQERLICEQLASGEPPHNLRAQALLALDKGETQAEAGRLSGLSAGQVGYWLGKFRRDRMNIFPKDLLLQTEPEPADAKLEDAAKTVKKSKKGKESKKEKKGKKKKAKKKDKKAKKKKAKRSKKRKKKSKKK